MTLKEVKEIRQIRAQHGRKPSFRSRLKTKLVSFKCIDDKLENYCGSSFSPLMNIGKNS